jgi:HEAT repeat protein
MIKKIYFILFTAALLLNVAHAQAPKDYKSIDVRIERLLASVPAKNAAMQKSNMVDIASFGDDGYLKLISGFGAPGKASNAAIEYAVAGFTVYATLPGNEEARKMSVSAYTKALQTLTYKKNMAFIISQFELVGKNDNVAFLQGFLTDNELVDNTVRALAKINTQSSKMAMLNALPKANGQAKISIIEGLEATRFKQAASALGRLATDGDANVAKVSLYALSYIADPVSEPVLAAAAQKADYKYEPTNATEAYMIYANELLKNGNKTLAVSIAKRVAEKTKTEKLANVRVNALQILVDANKTTAQQLLLTAAGDPNMKYRAGALRLAMPYITPVSAPAWINKLNTVNDPAKVDLLYVFSRCQTKKALPAVVAFLKSKDQHVRLAAINAAMNIGHEQVLGDLLKVMPNGSFLDVEAVSNAISQMKGTDITAQVAAALPTAKPENKVVLINILASRAANDQLNAINTQLKSTTPEVRQAAFTALRFVVTKDNLQQLFTLLNESNGTEEAAVQDAIVAAVHGTGSDSPQVDVIIQQIASAPENKKPLYFKALADLSGAKALKIVVDGYNSGNAAMQKPALDALSAWSDNTAAIELIKIARETKDAALLNTAVAGYIRSIKAGAYPAEEKLLMLRNAMVVAQTVAQKKQILKEIELAKCFNSLVFAGRYLDDTDLQQTAATAVINIALADEYNGNLVKNLLNKAILVTGTSSKLQDAARKYIADMKPGEGFVSMYNGVDLTGWKGLVEDPIKRSKMDAKTLADKQAKADMQAKQEWKPINGELHFDAKGYNNLATVKQYGDFEMLVDWKIIDDKKGQGDAGIYLRGSPQVQIWDNSRINAGAQVGSGGLYNNQTHESKPLKVADNKLDEWNTFRIIMKGDRVTVYLNGELVTDNIILENYWDRKLPIFAREQIELQAHGSPVAYRDLYIKELPEAKPFELSDEEKKDGFKVLFDGTNMFNWTGNTVDYTIEDGNIAINPRPGKGSGGNLYTKEEFSDFIYRFEFKLTPGANNGLGIRAPLEGDAAYTGMELQILDNEAPMYKDLHVYQYHGSVYGTIPAKRGFLKPVGEWNYEEVVVKGPKIKVILNGTEILDADITEARKNGAADGKSHPGLLRDSGHIGFLGHGDKVQFRNIRVKDLSKDK